MNKFERTNKETGEVTEMVGTNGKLLTITKNPKPNTNGHMFHNFTARIDMSRGPIVCQGQVYKKSFEYLGGKPEAGASFAFSTELDQLKQGNNKVWSISGLSVDAIDEGLLNDLDNL